ncbi:low-density lipoprotein receptor-related protein 6-like [Ruditapes philippinarum]|uniref:low-density lipoprotein receptor-related protein 6-like n=1 Tax=Ruditapes philippinarum TaxID=129788 RepID=UPI00295BD2F4|nr:low-density lipoprotein receptor-related protein 6-like [Ruditapes philippinarum]
MSSYNEDCFCSALLEDRVDPEVIDRHCSESDFSGLLFPKGDGIYTIKPNFIERGPRSTLSQAKPVKILSTKFPVKAVASDVRKMKIFFYEYSTNVIKSLSTLENSEPEVVSLAVGEVGSLAFDGNYLYWTDIEYGHIMVVREDGTFPHILHRDLGQPKALALHPQRRVMIWSELATGTLMWSYLDGSSKTQINMMTTYQIRDIAIDFSSGSEVRMYLCDDSAVYETDKGGSFFIIHYRKTFRHRFTGMTILHDYLVLTDTKLKSSGLHVFDRKVFDKDGRIRNVGESLFPFYKYGNWYGARYHHISNQPKNKLDICRVKRAKCEHLCLPGSRSYTCVCSTGYKKNDSDCIIDEPYTTFIFVSDMRYSKLLQIPDVTRQFVAVPTQGLHQPYSLAYDPVYKMLYWSDLETGTISRSFMNGTNQEVIKYDPHAYFIGLFIEPGSRLLLYMVRNKPEFDLYRQPIGSLVAMNIDTMKSAVLLKRALGAPHSVTVNVKHGYIYMTEQRNIWRINFGNFTDFICLASQVLSTIVTTADDYVYFVNEIPVETYYEPKKTQIVRFGIDGENMTALFDLKGGTVYDLAVDKYFIYWINGSTRSVQRVNLDNYDVIEDVGPSKSLFKPTSLYVSPTEYNYDSVCTNFECKGVCLPALTEAVCEENSVSEIVEVHNDSALCVIPDIKYGDILHNQAGRVVPRGYTATVQCFPAHAVTGSATITCLGGVWSDTPTCNLEYSICGTPKKGYKVYRESGSFFVYPGATLLAVICIGGGGGGYDVKNDVIVRSGKAGDGGDSSFGSHLNAFGGTGGSVNEGGKGGKGHMDGGPGSAGSNCTTGGTAGVGQITPDTGEPDYSAELFCGTGGFSHECTSIQETLDEYAGPGGRDGNGSYAGNFGGGAGRQEGGSGGGGGWSSLTFSLPEKELVPVTVGEAGFPSYGTPAPGLVVVSWGDFRIDRFAKSYDIINECVLGDVDYEL